MGEKSYINVIFPMANTTQIKIFINGVKLTPPPFPVINTNGTHYFIYFEFTLSKRNVTAQFWLLADLTGSEGEPDYKVDMIDLGTVAKGYGAYPSHPDWNPICDLTGSEYLTPDEKVDVLDLYLIARDFGKICS